MKRFLYIVLIVVLAVGVAIFNLSINPEKPKPAAATNPPVENQQPVEKVYNKGAETIIYLHPEAEALTIDEKIQNGTKLKILGRQNGFYHVQYDVQGESKEGYIPNWYLDDEKAAIAGCDYGYQLLKEDTEGLLYPEGNKIIKLEQGRLLKPFMESGDWVQVRIMAYDIPSVLAAWVPKNVLGPTDSVQPKEGFIPSDAELYFVVEYKDIKNAKPQKEAYPKSVFINKREGGYAYVGAAGGWNAWVEEKWITYTDKDLK